MEQVPLSETTMSSVQTEQVPLSETMSSSTGTWQAITPTQ